MYYQSRVDPIIVQDAMFLTPSFVGTLFRVRRRSRQ
jgi:hypothetical protein